MKLFNKAIVVLSLASLFCIGACKKAEAPKSTEEVVQALKSWNKADVNALLGYIPADSPLVLTTTRQVDASHPAFKKLLEKNVKYFDDTVSALEKKAAKDPTEYDPKTIASIKSIRPLLADYQKNAADWGLDPDAHIDAVVYLKDNALVLKLSTADSQKAKAKIDTFLNDWKSIGQTPNDPNAPSLVELKAGNTTWYTFDATKAFEDPDDCILCQNGKTLAPSVLAYNIDNNIITATFIKSGDTATLESLLKLADKPMTKDALGKIEENVYLLGYAENTKLFEKLASNDAIRNFVKEEGDIDLTPVCVKDISSLIDLFPKLSVSGKLENDGEVINKAILEMSDKAEIKKIQNLTVEHLSVAGEHSLATAGINLNIDKSVAYLKDVFKRGSERKFACEAMNPLFPEEWTESLDELADPQIKMFTSAINGVNLAIDKLNLADDKFEIEAIANIAGPTMSTSYPMMAGMAAMADPEVGTMLALKKDEVKTIDLSKLAEKPLNVNAILTEKDVVVGTQTYDVKAISGGKRSNDGTILNLGFNASIFNTLGLDLDGVVFSDSTTNIEIGINDKGFAFQLSSKL